MADYLNPQDLANAKVDAKTLGEAVNDKKVVKPRYGDSYKSIPLLSADGDLAITELNKAINIAAAAGAGANGWTDKLVQTWSGRTQESKNKDIINARDYGIVGDGVTDDTAAIQRALDAAISRTMQTGRRATLVIDDMCYVKKVGSTGGVWGHCFIVPSNITIKGDGVIVSDHKHENRTVIFLCRGSNIDFQGLSSIGGYDILIGGGTTYDYGIEDGTYRNIQLYNLDMKNWIGASFQMRRSDSGGVFFEDIDYVLCNDEAKEGGASSGNFNFRSDPPHKLRNCRMALCVGRNGATASTFNYVGVKGGSVSSCTSYNNRYAGCELENGTEDVIVSNLTSNDDYAALWIDDSKNIVANTIIVNNTVDSIESPLLPTRGKVRPAVWITYQGFGSEPEYHTDNILVTNVIGSNSRILVEKFGTAQEGYKPSVGSLDFKNITLTNDIDVSIVPILINRCDKLTLSSIKVTSNPNIDTLRAGSTTEAYIDDFKMMNQEAGVGGIKFVNDSKLTLLNSDVSNLSVTNATTNRYSNNQVGGKRFYDLAGQIRSYQAGHGSPEGVIAAPVGSTYTRLDDFGEYVKTTASGSTGWKRRQLD